MPPTALLDAALPATPVVPAVDERWVAPPARSVRRKQTVSTPAATMTMAGARHAFWLNPDDRNAHQAQFRVRRPDNTAGPSVMLSVTVESTKTVVTQRGSDESGFLSFELRSDTATMTGTFTFTRAGIVGAKVVDALPSIELLQDFRAPNVLQVSWTSGEFVDFQELPPSNEMFPESLMEYLRALASLQPYAGTPVVIPDLTRVSRRDARVVKDAARLVGGDTVEGEWEAFTLAPGTAIDPRAHYELNSVCRTTAISRGLPRLTTIRPAVTSVPRRPSGRADASVIISASSSAPCIARAPSPPMAQHLPTSTTTTATTRPAQHRAAGPHMSGWAPSLNRSPHSISLAPASRCLPVQAGRSGDKQPRLLLESSACLSPAMRSGTRDWSITPTRSSRFTGLATTGRYSCVPTGISPGAARPAAATARRSFKPSNRFWIVARNWTFR